MGRRTDPRPGNNPAKPRRPQPDKSKVPARAPTADDLFEARLREQCARSIVKYIKDGMDTRRTIKSITLKEFEGMAASCVSEFICGVAKRLDEDLLEPAQRDVARNFLLGG